MAISVTDHGAVGNGQRDDSDAFDKAIAAAASSNEPVLVPSGKYRLTRTVRLREGIDIQGEDSSRSLLIHDLKGQSDAHREANAVCLALDETPPNQPTKLIRDVTIQRLCITTTEPRLRLRQERQTALYVRGVVYNCLVRELLVRDFFQGIFLRQCWTARVQNCAVQGARLHCLKWENATAGEITGNRFDCFGDAVTGEGNSAAFVTFAHVDENEETMALSVSNNAFQSSERAGFYGRGIGNLTMINNFFERNNRGNHQNTASLHLDDDSGREPKETRVANVIGGFWTPGKDGRGAAIRIEAYDIVNLMGVDIRGSRFSHGIIATSPRTRLNLIGVHSERPNILSTDHLNESQSLIQYDSGQ